MKVIVIFVLLITANISFCQNIGDQEPDITYSHVSDSELDTLVQAITYYSGEKDTARLSTILRIGIAILYSSPQRSLKVAEEGLRRAKEIKNQHGEDFGNICMALSLWTMGKYSQATQIAIENYKFSQQLQDNNTIFTGRQILSNCFRDQNNFSQAFKYLDAQDYGNLAGIYDEMNKPDSALYYLKKTDAEDDKWILMIYGNSYLKLGNYKVAKEFYKRSIAASTKLNNLKDLSEAYLGLAKVFQQEGSIDSCVYYAKKSYRIAQSGPFNRPILRSGLLLSEVYEKTDPTESLRYLKLAMSAKDSIIDVQQISKSYSSEFNEERRLREYEAAKTKYQNEVRMYALIAGLIVFAVIAVILLRNNQNRKKSYALLEKQKLETDNQKQKVEKTLDQLKSTQSQLIQSEKMASLGELTAGIAHEIQNPLNFVNNFSDVNKELIDEMESEIDKGNLDNVKTIAKDLRENQGKINHHGKRADAIVKGMLQHSRSSNGVKEPTDINALADEYLRLAYHGIRAKDKSFNVTTKTDFDSAIGKIDVVPQEIGRVILNLITNAFYTVAEKKTQKGSDYEPSITVRTKRNADHISISVIDNGNGISSKVLDKIFQPFFTTKPTGQGTGLGLSLSYDIVKAQGGEIRVETKEGQGSEFIVSITI